MRKLKRPALALLVLLLAVCVIAGAGAEDIRALDLPVFTETDCVWDDAGNLISETAHDQSGAPALNSRGFYRAEYTYDKENNLLTEAYFGLEDEPVNADGGYAKAEFAYEKDPKGKTHLVSEDRYAADGSRP